MTDYKKIVITENTICLYYYNDIKCVDENNIIIDTVKICGSNLKINKADDFIIEIKGIIQRVDLIEI